MFSLHAAEKQKMSLTKVFVYGTLRRGQPNHFLLSEEYGVAQFVGAAQLVDKYPMVIYTGRNVPFLLSAEGQGKVSECAVHSMCLYCHPPPPPSHTHTLQNVVGDLYNVDAKMLARLDILEDHPNLYTRTTVDCLLHTAREQILQAQVYMLHNYNKAMLNEPFLVDYCLEAASRPYTYREKGERTNHQYNIINDVKEQ